MGTQSRIVQGRTVIKYNGQIIALCQSMTVSENSPVGGGIIKAINQQHPVEVVAGVGYQGGTLTIGLIEQWNEPLFAKFGFNTNSISDVLNRDDATIVVEEIVTDENGSPIRTNTYHNCRITGGGISQNRTLKTDSTTIPYSITLTYAYMT